MEDNRLLDYMERLFSAKEQGDNAGYACILSEGEGETVSLKEVALTLGDVIEGVVDYVDDSVSALQAVMEERLNTVIESLDPDTQQKIYSIFEEVEGSSLYNEREELNNGEEK